METSMTFEMRSPIYIADFNFGSSKLDLNTIDKKLEDFKAIIDRGEESRPRQETPPPINWDTPRTRSREEIMESNKRLMYEYHSELKRLGGRPSREPRPQLVCQVDFYDNMLHWFDDELHVMRHCDPPLFESGHISREKDKFEEELLQWHDFRAAQQKAASGSPIRLDDPELLFQLYDEQLRQALLHLRTWRAYHIYQKGQLETSQQIQEYYMEAIRMRRSDRVHEGLDVEADDHLEDMYAELDREIKSWVGLKEVLTRIECEFGNIKRENVETLSPSSLSLFEKQLKADAGELQHRLRCICGISGLMFEAQNGTLGCFERLRSIETSISGFFERLCRWEVSQKRCQEEMAMTDSPENNESSSEPMKMQLWLKIVADQEEKIKISNSWVEFWQSYVGYWNSEIKPGKPRAGWENLQNRAKQGRKNELKARISAGLDKDLLEELKQGFDAFKARFAPHRAVQGQTYSPSAVPDPVDVTRMETSTPTTTASPSTLDQQEADGSASAPTSRDRRHVGSYSEEILLINPRKRKAVDTLANARPTKRRRPNGLESGPDKRSSDSMELDVGKSERQNVDGGPAPNKETPREGDRPQQPRKQCRDRNHLVSSVQKPNQRYNLRTRRAQGSSSTDPFGLMIGAIERQFRPQGRAGDGDEEMTNYYSNPVSDFPPSSEFSSDNQNPKPSSDAAEQAQTSQEDQRKLVPTKTRRQPRRNPQNANGDQPLRRSKRLQEKATQKQAKLTTLHKTISGKVEKTSRSKRARR